MISAFYLAAGPTTTTSVIIAPEPPIIGNDGLNLDLKKNYIHIVFSTNILMFVFCFINAKKIPVLR